MCRVKTPLPLHIREALSDELISILNEDRHCMSFPNQLLVQVRMQHQKQIIFKKSYSLKSFESIQQAIETIIVDVKVQRQTVLTNYVPIHTSARGLNGFNQYTKVDKRRKENNVYYAYYFNYKCPQTNKWRQRIFHHGATAPTPAQHLHVLHTVLFLRHELRQKKEAFRMSDYPEWRNYRYYNTPHEPIDYLNLQ